MISLFDVLEGVRFMLSEECHPRSVLQPLRDEAEMHYHVLRSTMTSEPPVSADWECSGHDASQQRLLPEPAKVSFKPRTRSRRVWTHGVMTYFLRSRSNTSGAEFCSIELCVVLMLFCVFAFCCACGRESGGGNVLTGFHTQ